MRAKKGHTIDELMVIKLFILIMQEIIFIVAIVSAVIIPNADKKIILAILLTLFSTFL